MQFLHTEFIQPICIPSTEVDFETDLIGTRALLVGWGQTETGKISNILQKFSVPFISLKECNSTYVGGLVPEQVRLFILPLI